MVGRELLTQSLRRGEDHQGVPPVLGDFSKGWQRMCINFKNLIVMMKRMALH